MAGIVPFNKREWLRRNPFEDFYSMFDGFFNNMWPTRVGSMFHDTFRLDVKEDKKQYIVEADLPGVKKEEIDIDLFDGRLTISVKRTNEIEAETNNYIHRERSFSSMQRSVYLDNAKNEGVTAKLENGVLRIVIPKENKRGSSNRIEIQ